MDETTINQTTSQPTAPKQKKKKNPFAYLISTAIFGGICLGAILYCIVQLAGRAA